MKVGVIVGRFQVNELHNGHLRLIEAVQSNNDRVIIFLGCGATTGNKQYNLNYNVREVMMKSIVPNASICALKDKPTDKEWSRKLDEMIDVMCDPLDTVTLYGGRNSFINRYTTKKHQTEEMNFGDNGLNASDIRKTIGNQVINSSDFRAGIIHGVQNQRPIIWPTVDIAACKKINENEVISFEVVLGRKANESKWRFPGGFVDYSDDSFETAAKRELQEETGLVCEGGLKYICNVEVDDWRYRGIDNQKIMTTFYYAPYSHGSIKGDDDLPIVKWFHLGDIEDSQIVSNHIILLRKLREFILDGSAI